MIRYNCVVNSAVDYLEIVSEYLGFDPVFFLSCINEQPHYDVTIKGIAMDEDSEARESAC